MSERVATGVRRQLRLRWTGVAVGCSLLALGGYVTLSDLWTMAHGRKWITATTLVFAYELAILGRSLDRNRQTETARLRASFGLANLVTLARGALLALLAGFVLVPQPTGAAAWLASGLYGTAAVLDRVDGAVARLRGGTTLLGAQLDAKFDGVGLLVGGAVGVAYGTLPVWYLAVGLARFGFDAGVWLRRSRGRPIGSLPGSRWRRRLAGLQMVVVAVALTPVVVPPLTTVLATVAMGPFLIHFAADWLAVTGRQ